MQLPSSIQVDQFHGYPAIDNNALSIASSRRFKPERKSAFLEHKMRHENWRWLSISRHTKTEATDLLHF